MLALPGSPEVGGVRVRVVVVAVAGAAKLYLPAMEQAAEAAGPEGAAALVVSADRPEAPALLSSA
jgi:hypothetical protein